MNNCIQTINYPLGNLDVKSHEKNEKVPKDVEMTVCSANSTFQNELFLKTQFPNKLAKVVFKKRKTSKKVNNSEMYSSLYSNCQSLVRKKRFGHAYYNKNDYKKVAYPNKIIDIKNDNNVINNGKIHKKYRNSLYNIKKNIFKSKENSMKKTGKKINDSLRNRKKYERSFEEKTLRLPRLSKCLGYGMGIYKVETLRGW